MRKADAGTLWLDGADVTKSTSVAIGAGGVRRTFQRIQTYGWLSVEDNVLAALDWHGGGGGLVADLFRLRPRRRIERARRDQVGEVLQACGLFDIRSSRVCDLPLGRARMVEFARAIVDHPKLLLFDEPTSGLDAADAEIMGDHIEALLKISVVRNPARRAQRLVRPAVCAPCRGPGPRPGAGRRDSRGDTERPRRPSCVPHELGGLRDGRMSRKNSTANRTVQYVIEKAHVRFLGGTAAVGRRERKTQMRFRRTAGITVGLLLATATLAACSSTTAATTTTTTSSASSSSTTSAGGTNNSDPSQGVTATSITVGGIATLSSFASMADGANAVFDQVNNSGGIDGRKINFIGIQDDGGVPATDQTDVNNLVESSHVFAIVPEVGFVFAGGPVITNNDVPFFGWGFSAPFCEGNLGFGFNGCLSNPSGKYANGGFGAVFKELLGGTTAQTGKTIAIVNTDNQPGHASTALIAASAVAAGVKVANDDLYIPTNGTTDYSTYAQKVISSGAALVFNSGNLDTVTGLNEELRSLGYKGILSDPTAYDPALSPVPQLQGENVLLQLGPWQSSAASIQTMIPTIKAYDTSSGKTTPMNLGVEIGYVCAEMFVQALQPDGPRPQRATFLAAANNNWTFQIPGLAAPITFPQGHQVMAPCMAVVQIENKTYKATQPLTCGKVLTLK